ncbi:PREDICTED: S-adenosylmethionine mitochondrial carrier protein-like, partial [Nicrophorus vespilloides]|uniref:S-adenosylmethionine mitochondrial carrier protein-like n=1 Tax=Nicrophorus vespilloides TaxID=110193 RepID=A0ABM1NJ84_NICVS
GEGIAGLAADVSLFPLDMLKTRLQAPQGFKRSDGFNDALVLKFLEALRKVRGLYRGFGSTVLREVPFSFIRFPILEYFKNVYRIKLINNINLEPWEVANCGAVAAL